MKHYFDTNGKELERVPDPFHGASPMYKKDGSVDEVKFKAMGGTIAEDSEKSPKEKFFGALNDYLDELEEQAEDLALHITKEDFVAAAGSMLSSELVAWATDKGVPDEMIKKAREQILTFVADASRLGMTWNDIVPKVEVNK